MAILALWIAINSLVFGSGWVKSCLDFGVSGFRTSEFQRFTLNLKKMRAGCLETKQLLSV